MSTALKKGFGRYENNLGPHIFLRPSVRVLLCKRYLIEAINAREDDQ